MRPLEIMLLGTLSFTLVLFAIPFQVRSARPLAAAGVTIIALGLHWLIEGTRWQMYPAYGFAVLLLLIGLAKVLSKSGGWNLGVGWTVALSLAGILLLAISIFLPFALPVPKMLTPTGPFNIGSSSFYLKDDSRSELYSENSGDLREFVGQIWYPADEIPRDAEKVPFIENLETAVPEIAEWFGFPSFLLDHLKLVDVNAYKDIPMSTEADDIPLLVFNHGLGGIRQQNLSLMHELASHGYMVVALDFTYATTISSFPDGRVILRNQDVTNAEVDNPPNKLVTQWADDIRFMLVEMGQGNVLPELVLDDRIDLNTVGMFGHSTGGAATLEFCADDVRCLAMVLLDSWMEPVSEDNLDLNYLLPMLFLQTPRWLGADNKPLGERMLAAQSSNTTAINIDGAQHFDFTDVPLMTPFGERLGVSGSINGRRAVTIVNAYTVAFFDERLRGIEPPIMAFPEAKVILD